MKPTSSSFMPQFVYFFSPKKEKPTEEILLEEEVYVSTKEGLILTQLKIVHNKHFSKEKILSSLYHFRELYLMKFQGIQTFSDIVEYAKKDIVWPFNKPKSNREGNIKTACHCIEKLLMDLIVTGNPEFSGIQLKVFICIPAT